MNFPAFILLLIVLNGIEMKKLDSAGNAYFLLIVLNGIEITLNKKLLMFRTKLLIVLNGIEIPSTICFCSMQAFF